MAKTLRSVAFATVLTVLFPFVGGTQTLPAATDSLAPDFRIQVFGDTVTDFPSRIERYFELRGQLERGLPAMTVTEDVRQIRRRTRSLAKAIRAARRGAVQGEFFTAATSAEFKRVLALIMNTAVWALIMDENPGAFRHDIDGSYPDVKTYSTMPGIVLARLPQLPDDIQFRFVGPHLILYDVRASTIIDRLPNAIECADDCDD